MTAVANNTLPIAAMGPAANAEPANGHAQITADTLLNANAKDRQLLTDIHELLDSIFVRNKNQHRRTHWFKSLQQFHRQLELLLEELDGNKKSLIGKNVEARLQYWDKDCIHNWYLSFTQLVAVGPFSMLGLVLMACTARVCRITGITALYEEIASEDLKMALDMVNEGQAEEELGSLLGGGEDEGEVIARWNPNL